MTSLSLGTLQTEVLTQTFSGDGKQNTAIGTGSDLGQAIAVQNDGKILVAGQSNTSGNNFGIVRYLSDGTLDTSFNSTGIINQNFSGSSDDRAASISIQNNGKVVAAGTSTTSGNYDFAIARYNSDGSIDTRMDISNTLGGTINYTENGSAVVMDSDVVIFDSELSSANNFASSTLTLVRNGGANTQDQFVGTGTLSSLTQGGNLVVGGTTIGTVTANSGGTLVLMFNSSATQTFVNSVLRQIAYSNSSDAPFFHSSDQLDIQRR